MKGFKVKVYRWERVIIYLAWISIIFCLLSIAFIHKYIFISIRLMMTMGYIMLAIVIEIRYREYRLNKHNKSFDNKYPNNKMAEL